MVEAKHPLQLGRALALASYDLIELNLSFSE
jgi:hypothetical protein